MKTTNTTIKALAAVCGLSLMTALSPVAKAQVQAPPFEIGQSRPRLVVLLHGVTPKVSEEPDQKIARSGHARHYWGYDFIKGLQGRTDEESMQVITPRVGNQMRAINTAPSDWRANTPDTTFLDYSPICFPVSGWGTIPAGMTHNQAFIKDYIRLMTAKGGVQNPMVMINTRDGSKHFMPQLAETIEEVYQSYVIAFGHLPLNQQPQIYLVGHSFGGVIARGILANPTLPDLFGNRLTAAQRLRADYLRERVVLVKTLAAPHEGTFIGDPASDVSDFMAANGRIPISNVIGAIEHLSNPLRLLSKDEANAKVDAAMERMIDAIAGKRDCLQDLHRMNEYNTGILHPSTARRSARGPLVPIYTAAGRNPGGRFFDEDRGVFLLGGAKYNPVSTLDLIQGTRPSTEASALNLIGAFLHAHGYGKEGKRPWGTATASVGDRTKSPFQGLGPNSPRGLATPWSPNFFDLASVSSQFLRGNVYETMEGDGEWDNDGFLGWDSAHAFHLQANNYYRVFDNAKYGSQLPWDIDNHGSIMFSAANGAWIHNELLRDAGPFVSQGERRSIWGQFDFPDTPSNGIKVEVLQVQDESESLDNGSGADFQLSVQIDGTEKTVNLPEGDNITSRIPDFQKDRIANTVIPIRIKVIERDTPDPDDICVVSPKPGQTSMYLFYDTRTNRIMGDVNAVGGEIIETRPGWWGVDNKVKTRIRITKVIPS